MRDFDSMIRRMPWPKTGRANYHAQFGLPDKCCTIKGLVVYNS